MLFFKIKHWDDKIARLNVRCDFWGTDYQSSYCEGPYIKKEKQQVIKCLLFCMCLFSANYFF